MTIKFNIQSVIRIGILALLFVSLFAFTAFMSTTQASPSTAIATKTFRITPTPTPTQSVLISNLRKQLAYGVGGGARGPCSDYASQTRPSIIYNNRSMDSNDIVCLMGFPLNQLIWVKIYDPYHQLAATVPIYTQENQGLPGEKGSWLSLMQLTNQAPAGKWTIVAEGSGLNVTGAFNHPGSVTGPETFYDILPGAVYTLSKSVPPGTAWYDSRRTKILKSEDSLVVDGISNKPNRSIQVAIYTDDPTANYPTMVLVTTQMVRTDSRGIFSAGFKITSQFKPGTYYVLVDPDQIQEPFFRMSRITFEVIKPTQVCSNTMPSLLQKDHFAIVSAGTPNNVREKPGLKNRLIGKLNENELVEILAGPKCADGMVWWKVYSRNTGLDGWTAEGSKGDYWLNSVVF